MRKQLLLSSALVLASTAFGQIVIVDQNFDEFTAGVKIAQSAGAPWTTWSMAPGGTEDATVSNEQAASGTNSGKWVSTAATGGPIDMVVQLGDRVTGAWTIDFKMFIPTGKGGYFNILHDFNGTNSTWAIEISFLANGNIRTQLQGITDEVGVYPHDAWFDVHVDIDLDNDEAEFLVNNSSLQAWTFSWDAASALTSMLKLDGLNFFAYAGGTDQCTYYIDDLRIASAPGTGVHALTGQRLALFPNPTAGHLDVLVDAMGSTGLWAVRDLTGRLVKEGVLPAMAERAELEVAALPAGPYFFELQRNGGRQVQRFVKR